MKVTYQIIGHIDADLGIREDNHEIDVLLDDHTWFKMEYDQQIVLLDELADVLRHSLTNYGQIHYTIHANHEKGLDYEYQS